MRPVDTRKIPVGDDWIAERKWDGSRAQITVNGGVRITNRRQNDKTRNFPELQVLKKSVNGSAVLDGELVIDDSFKRLSEREHLKDKSDIDRLAKADPATFKAFDITSYHGKDLSKLPLEERKKLLNKAVDARSPRIDIVKTSDNLVKFTEKMKKAGAEGVVFKDEESQYLHGRKTKDWQKLKFKKTADVVITGYEKGEGKRKGLIGALNISVKSGNKLESVGKVGTGFTDVENKKLKAMLDAGKQPVIRVEYLKKGSRGALREPVYIGLRSDIRAQQTHKEG